LLWRHFGIRPEDAYSKHPSWQMNLLLRGIRDELGVDERPRDSIRDRLAFGGEAEAPAAFGDLPVNG
jgi:hypothetical protein